MGKFGYSRDLVDACCYGVRTGCAWRQLPREFPHWDNVYKTFRRWSAQGRFEALHDRLRAQWRERIERTAAPSAAWWSTPFILRGGVGKAQCAHADFVFK